MKALGVSANCRPERRFAAAAWAAWRGGGSLSAGRCHAHPACRSGDHVVDEDGGHPVRVVGGRYLAPTTPGYSIEIRPESLSEYAFPDGAGWWKLVELPV